MSGPTAHPTPASTSLAWVAGYPGSPGLSSLGSSPEIDGFSRAVSRATQRPVKLDNARIALTGATGFLGGYLVETLLSRGAHVIAVVRNPAKAAALARRGVEVR